MQLSTRLIVSFVLVSVVAATASEGACGELVQMDDTYFPNDAAYVELNQGMTLTHVPQIPSANRGLLDYFNAASWLSPQCIFVPKSPETMSTAVKLLGNTNTPFAIRGGGHMPITNAANINSSGILLASSGLNKLQLSADKSVLEVGAGNVWADVYKYLEPHKLTVVGGRSGMCCAV